MCDVWRGRARGSVEQTILGSDGRLRGAVLYFGALEFGVGVSIGVGYVGTYNR